MCGGGARRGGIAAAERAWSRFGRGARGGECRTFVSARSAPPAAHNEPMTRRWARREERMVRMASAGSVRAVSARDGMAWGGASVQCGVRIARRERAGRERASSSGKSRLLRVGCPNGDGLPMKWSRFNPIGESRPMGTRPAAEAPPPRSGSSRRTAVGERGNHHVVGGVAAAPPPLRCRRRCCSASTVGAAAWHAA